jgi:hypothetical protein
MWVQEREPSLGYKGPVPAGPSRLRVAGGLDTTYVPLVLVNNDIVTLWFEVARVAGAAEVNNAQVAIAFRHLPGFVTPEATPGSGLSPFDIDAWVHSSDSQLKVAILGWRGDADTTRDVYVLRTGFYWRP